MTTVPVLDVLLVVAEFMGLFIATWITWFALISVYQILVRRTRHGGENADTRTSLDLQ